MIRLPNFLKRPSMAENLWGTCSLTKELYLHLHGRETKEDVIALHDKPIKMEIRTSRQTTRQKGAWDYESINWLRGMSSLHNKHIFHVCWILT